jgi:type I restriction enzyme, S subunit
MIKVPDGWEVKPLKSIGTCKNGLTYSPDDIVENGGLLVLRSSNIQNSQIALEDNVFVREDIKVNYKVQEYDILVCVRNGSKNLIGKNALITKEVENMAHGAFMTVFHSKINKYIFQIFQSDLFFKQVEKNLGATINSINNSDLLLFEFPFPKEKKEQEKIAKILSTLDNVIESTNRIIEKEKNIKTALMQELLTNGIDKNGQIRTPQTHTYKPSELGLIPDEWEVKALKSVGSCKNGLTYSPDDIVESDGVLVLRSSNIKNNKLTFSDNVFVREDMKVNYKVQENDILICVRNGSKNLIGKNALITRESINMAHGAFMTVFHSNINEYVFQLFQSDLFFKQVEKNLGATINSINNSDLLLFDFSFPKDEIEQKQITKILTTQDEKIEIEEKNLAKLKELKKGLMNDLLSGEVRVKV